MRSSDPRFTGRRLLTCLLCSLSLTGSVLAHDMEDEWRFASYLLATGDSEAAVTSLKRYALFGDNGSQQLQARFIIGSIFAQQEKYQLSAVSFQDIASDENVPPEAREWSAFLAAQSLLLGRRLADYNIFLTDEENRISPIFSDQGSKIRSYLLGFLGVYANDQALQSRLTPIAEQDQEQLGNYCAGLMERGHWWDERTKKKAWLAGAFSAVVPGLGQIYNERYLDAGTAAAVIGGLGYWSYRLFERDQNSWGWTLGVLSGLMYLGNIRNTVIDSHRFNARAEIAFKNELVATYFPIFSVSVRDEALTFDMTFRPGKKQPSASRPRRGELERR